MTDREIRENFHNSRILDKAHSLAYEKAGGVEAFVKSGVQNIVEATMEEAYLLGWRDAEANAKAADTTGDTVEALFLQGVDRDRVREQLQEAGIPAMIYYPVPLHMQKAYQDPRYHEGDFPTAERLAACVLSLPMHTELDEEQLAFITENVLKAVVGRKSKVVGR